MFKGMTRYVVATGIALCMTSSAFSQSVRVHNHSPAAHSPATHSPAAHNPNVRVSAVPNATVKRVVKKNWVSGDFVWQGRTLRWVPGHYEYKTVVMSCGPGHWTRQYGRDVWVAGRCSVI